MFFGASTAQIEDGVNEDILGAAETVHSEVENLPSLEDKNVFVRTRITLT